MSISIYLSIYLYIYIYSHRCPYMRRSTDQERPSTSRSGTACRKKRNRLKVPCAPR